MKYKLFFLLLLCGCCRSKSSKSSLQDTASLVRNEAVQSQTDTTSKIPDNVKPVVIPIESRSEIPKKKHRFWKADLIIIKMKNHFKEVRKQWINDSTKHVQDSIVKTLQQKSDSIWNEGEKIKFDTSYSSIKKVLDSITKRRIDSIYLIKDTLRIVVGKDTLILHRHSNNEYY